MSRLVAVSNRVAVPKRSAAPGGLAVGLLLALQVRGGVWFGWNGEVGDGPRLRYNVTPAPSEVRCDAMTRYRGLGTESLFHRRGFLA